ncbi:DUF3131 domain-containing protein [Thermococcus alcaliphilus]|uniref:DUF3131 domain-containing protein n=1 Tax=Thermococcus alcaliphilus TaxID=139207 RepID=UPI002091A79B|nr:DUF3131 domain-containing protein [Thermococcus alcaliphilus]MCO6040478.1 DUF3131 domain-containing protein [Thermococcus alcaliphilus]
MAIEFENSYKWIKQRILYNGIKAHRAGFKHLWVVYPFRNEPLRNGWVSNYLKELGMNLEIVSPEEIEERVRKFLESL